MREGGGFTLLFERRIIDLAPLMPVKTLGQKLGVTDTRVWRLVEHHLNRAREKLDPSRVARVGFDETSRRSGHDYVSIFMDLDTRRPKQDASRKPGRPARVLRASHPGRSLECHTLYYVYVDAGTGLLLKNVVLVNQDIYILGRGYVGITETKVPEKYFRAGAFRRPCNGANAQRR